MQSPENEEKDMNKQFFKSPQIISASKMKVAHSLCRNTLQNIKEERNQIFDSLENRRSTRREEEEKEMGINRINMKELLYSEKGEERKDEERREKNGEYERVREGVRERRLGKGEEGVDNDMPVFLRKNQSSEQSGKTSSPRDMRRASLSSSVLSLRRARPIDVSIHISYIHIYIYTSIHIYIHDT
jgi:hypothetical protein